MHTLPKGIAFSQLLDKIWCPVCGGKLSVEEKDGKKTLVCGLHGEMKCFLDADPRAAMVRVCGELSTKGLEVS